MWWFDMEWPMCLLASSGSISTVDYHAHFILIWPTTHNVNSRKSHIIWDVNLFHNPGHFVLRFTTRWILPFCPKHLCSSFRCAYHHEWFPYSKDNLTAAYSMFNITKYIHVWMHASTHSGINQRMCQRAELFLCCSNLNRWDRLSLQLLKCSPLTQVLGRAVIEN